MNKIRVAAYCRVSTNHEEQDSSFEAQISYYEKLICGHKDWKLVNIYAEKASGTQMEKRPEFLKMRYFVRVVKEITCCAGFRHLAINAFTNKKSVL